MQRFSVISVISVGLLLSSSLFCPTERKERTESFFAPCKDFLSFPSFLWDYYYHRLFFMSHGKKGKNGKFYFAPCKVFPSFPSFLWDYYYHRLFVCPTERKERTENFTLHHAKSFCHFRHFCGTIIIIVCFFMSHGKKGKNGNFLCTLQSLSVISVISVGLFFILISFYFIFRTGVN